MAKRPPKTNGKAEGRMTRTLDRLTQFEDFEKTILPQLQKDIRRGITAKEMASKYSALAMARLITVAMTSENEAQVERAGVKVVEFGDGKATERKEVSHRLEKLPQEQMDALLLTELGEVEEEGTDDEA
jgi:hypothetical protein